jgi:hypothetical protein
MNTAIDRIRYLLGPQLEELGGAHLSGQIPLTDAVINRAAAAKLAAMSGPVADAHVHAADGDVLQVALTVRGVPLISTVPVRLQIDQQPELPSSPVLGLHWSLAGLGALARLASPFIERLAKLPPGVRMDGDRLLIDLADLLRAQGLGDLLRLVTRLEVHTRDGQVLVSFEAHA